MNRIRIFLGAVTLGAAVTSHAWPTALNFMPVVDVLAHREIYFNVGASGTERHIDKKIGYANSVAIGLFDRLEVGYDNDFEGNSSGHVKVALFDDGKRGLSAGYVGVSGNQKSGFIVGRHELGEKARLHVGWMHDGKNRSLIGIDLAIDDTWTFMADSVGGEDGYTYVGLNGGLFGLPGFDVTFTGGIPHMRDMGYTWTVAVGYSSRF